MKELSTEQKAKLYNEVLEKARKELQTCGSTDCEAARQIFRFFPELKENEDERIKRELCKAIWTYIPNEEAHKYITWLERHDKKLPAGFYYVNSEGKKFNSDTFKYGDVILHVEKQDKQKSTDVEEVNFFDDFRKTDSEDEPKFHEGEWITNGDYIWKIVEVKPLDYILKSQDGNIVDDTISHVDEQFHSFTIQDANNGDVLSDGNTIFIFKDLLSDGSVMSYCDYNADSDESNTFCPLSMNLMCSKITPATKEQRDLLFQKMKEAGYKWDTEKKELKKIVVPIFNIGDTIAKKHNSDIHDFGSFTITDITGGKYWYNNRIICDITEQDEWEIYEPVRQKYAWSEEDEIMYRRLHNLIYSTPYCDSRKKLSDWLQSLKDRVQHQKQWKPTEEQMKALHDLNLAGDISYTGQGQVLIELYNDLKKL